MKRLSSIFLAAMSMLAMAQSSTVPSVTLSVDHIHSVFFDTNLSASADSAVKIASAVLNSLEFRDSILNYTFPCQNYGNRKCHAEPITGQTVLDSLYTKASVSLSLFLNDCGGGTFGYSHYGIPEITSCYHTVDDDDDHLPFAYKYAYHICHEYMHIVGFYHFKPPKHRIIRQDIAENTGWIAFYILERWYDSHKKVPGF
jgi:hypothetical protein